MKSWLKKPRGPRSLKLYVRVVREMKLPLAAIGLLAHLKTFAGSLGVFPSAETLAEQTGANRKTIFKHLGILDHHGLIQRVRRLDKETGKRTSNCYILNDEKVAELLARKALTHVPKKGTRPLCPKKRDASTSEDIVPNVVQMPKQGVA